MPFIRKKRVNESTYIYVVSNRRKGKQIIQTSTYIGKEEELPMILQNTSVVRMLTKHDLENLLYQTPVLLWKLMEEMSFQKILSNHFKEKEWGVDAAIAACVMILNYATDRQSKCKLAAWYDQTYLPQLLHLPAQKMNKDLLCRSMDQFTEENIYAIHAEIFKTANAKYDFSDDYLFYDTTSVTFEGNKCDLAERGYNTAHRYSPQIHIGLATTKERFPVMHKVFGGSTKDVSTLEKVMPLLEKTGNLEKTVFIVDRGITSKTNIKLIKSKNANFIFGKPKDKKISTLISSLKENDFSEFDKKKKTGDDEEDPIFFYETTHKEDLFSSDFSEDTFRKAMEKNKLKTSNLTDDQIKAIDSMQKGSRIDLTIEGKTYFVELKNGKLIMYQEDRLIIYWSKRLQEDNLKQREKKLKNITESLEKLVKNVDEYTEQKLYEKIGITCGKTYRKFFDITFADGKLTFKLKPEPIDLANKTEGRYAILTNTNLTPKEILDRYRSRNFVEMSFKDLKLFVNIGPPRHWKDNRVRTHVFLAILAMALRSVLELKVRKVYPSLTSEEVLLKLNNVRALVLKGKILKITGENEETRSIVAAIEK